MSNNALDEIGGQSKDVETWVFCCDTCRNYRGNLVCSKGVFIAFKGANLSGCIYYVGGKECRHCGRIT